MALTAAQITALHDDIAANANTVLINNVSTQIKNVAHDQGDNAFAVAAWYNLFAAVDFFGNYSSVPLGAIKAAIAHKNYTPGDQPPASGATAQATNDALLYLNRMLLGQSFQMEINNLLLVGNTFDATNASLVSSLKDATNTDMPLGANGVAQKGGWGGASGVQSVICRKGNRVEQLLATKGAGGSNTDGSTNLKAATFTYEGIIGVPDIVSAWGG